MVTLTAPESLIRRPIAPTTDTLHLAVLGPPYLTFGEQAVAFRTRKEFALLVYLALTRSPQPREHLARFLWPDHDEASARALLRTALCRLRQSLASSAGISSDAITAFRSGRDTVGREVVGLARNAVPSLTLDTALVEAAVSAQGEEMAKSAREVRLGSAAAAYRGPFLEGVTFDDAPELDDWVGEQRAYWQRRAEVILNRLTALQLGRRAFDEACSTTRRWIEIDPLSEAAHRSLMRALVGAGDRTAALAAYEDARAALRAGLGIDPSPETVTLAERLRRLPASALRRPESEEGAPKRVVSAEVAARELELPFVGREREFAALVEAYQAARAGDVQVVVLEGEVGIGKTRLAEEFLRWATLEGADVLRSQGDAAGGLLPDRMTVDALRPRLAREHAPEDLVTDVWLSELVRLFPELRERYPDLPSPTSLEGYEPAGQGRLNEAVLQLVLALAERAKPHALVTFYDDLRGADLRERELLLYRLQRQREAGVPHLLLVAVRSEALGGALELQHWLTRLSRRVPTRRLKLGPLSSAETAQAIASVVHQGEDRGTIGSQLSHWLYAQTEGQPFYLVETLRSLVGRGIIALESGENGFPRLTLGSEVERLPRSVPPSVREHIHGQLGELSPEAFAVLTAVAVLGPVATFDCLRKVTELGEGVALTALDELCHRRLLVEFVAEPHLGDENRAPLTYRFPYGMVREVVCREAGETRRGIYHRRAFGPIDIDGTADDETDDAADDVMAPQYALRLHLVAA